MIPIWGTSTGAKATLDLDFLGATSLDNRITFSRGSQATLFNSTGALVYAPNNVIRNNTMQGAVAGTPGTLPTNWVTTLRGLTQTVVGTGTQNGITYIDLRFNGTTTSSGGIEIKPDGNAGVIAATASQAWAMSSWVAIVGGSTANTTGQRFIINEYSAGPTYLRTAVAATNVLAGGATLTRVSGAITTGASTTIVEPIIILDVASGVAIDITLRIGMPQLEIGSVATAVNATSGTAYYGPRFDYNPSTLAPRGLLIEEQRTNSIRNNTMQGAVAGTPGTLPTNWVPFTALTGLTQSVVGTGTENGIVYVDVRLSGTPSGAGQWQIAPETTTSVVASSGQAWTFSTYYKLAAGSLAGISTTQISVTEYNAVGGYLDGTFVTVAAPSGVMQRASASRVFNNAATARAFSPIFLNLTGVAIDITLRIGLPQLEQGAFATSVIPTTTTALTRNADVASMTGTNFSSWYNASEGTLFAQASLISSSYTGGVLVDVGAGGAFGTTEYIAWTGSAWTLNPNTAPINVTSSVTTTSTAKVAAGMKVNDSVIAGNGLIGVTDTSCSIASAPTTLSIGKAGWSGGANYLNGYIQRISYYPVRLEASQLQALTA